MDVFNLLILTHLLLIIIQINLPALMSLDNSAMELLKQSKVKIGYSDQNPEHVRAETNSPAASLSKPVRQRTGSEIHSPNSPEKARRNISGIILNQSMRNDSAYTSQDTKGDTASVKKNFCISKSEKIINHWATTTFMTVITIYALFGDDIRLIAFPKSADDIFYVITSASLGFFAIEIVFSSIAKEGYFLGFYFWLDLIATLSLITDIGWVWDKIIGNEDFNASNAQQASQLARAGRGAKIGSRAGRIARIIRLIRLIRIVKLYKNANNALSKDEEEATGGEIGGVNPPDENLVLQSQEAAKASQERAGENFIKLQNVSDPHRMSDVNVNTSQLKIKQARVENDAEDDFKVPEESKVGKKLSDLTTKRVIILVLVMLLSSTMLTVSQWIGEYSSFDYGLKLMSQYETGSPGFNDAFQFYIEQGSKLRTPIILVNAQGITWESGIDTTLLRSAEKEIVSLDNAAYISIFDLRRNTNLEAGLSIGTTLFVTIVLASGALLFNKEASDLVIVPIEQMIVKVNRIAANPLKAAQEEENEALAMERFQEEQEKLHKKTKSKEAPLETVVLEQTIVKIGALLALGFGEAGSKIIAENMARSGDVNPMMQGNKVISIFGFCDIRNFTDATEVLQEGVMLFVNEIGEIVHGVVDHFSGAANKNIGDAFLLVWKFLPEDVGYNEDTDEIWLENTDSVSQIADMSVVSFIKIIAEIKRSRKLVKYRDHKGLNLRMPGYQVKMGFGLHVGWAIEGAIGSFYKIDASYLSPNVNMASRLEAATKQFGTPLLISGNLYDIFTARTKNYMRHIDTVTVKGSVEPLVLYTCDVVSDHLELEPLKPPMNRHLLKIARVRARKARDKYKQQCMDGQIQVSAKFETDQQIAFMRKPFTKNFTTIFNEGMKNYISGNWAKAKELFLSVEEAKGGLDYPTLSLLAVLRETNYVAPADWKGYRELTEK